MTENTEESGQEVGNKELPTPTFSSPSDDSQLSQSVDTNALAKQVADLLAPDIAKQVQSVKDKRFSKLEKTGNSTLETLEKLGVTIPDGVRDQLSLEMRLTALENVSSEPTSVAQVAAKAEDWSSVINEVGLDSRVPEVVNFIGGTFRDTDDFELQARRLKDKLSNATPLPPEQQAILQGNKVQTDAFTDAEVAEKEAELSELFRSPSKYKKRIEKLEKELEPYWA